MLPASFGRDPEHVFGAVLVVVFQYLVTSGFFLDIPIAVGIGGFASQLLAVFHERVGDVLQQDQSQHDTLVFGGIHVGAELVGRQPQLGFEAQVGSVRVRLLLGTFLSQATDPLRTAL